jgi:hypothetical protein
MSNYIPTGYDSDEANFDPDPFGFDKPPSPKQKRRRSHEHRASDTGNKEDLDSLASVSKSNAGSAPSDSTGGQLFFSVPNPWSDAHRAAPSEFLRCGLFRPMRRGRAPLTRKRLDANANVKQLIVSGPELSEFDLDIWLTVVHLLRSGPAELSRWSLMAASSRARGAEGSDALRESVKRLQEVQLVLHVRNEPSIQHPTPDEYHFEGRLIHRVEWQESAARRAREHRNERVQITLSPTLAPLFEKNRRTLMFSSDRAAIGDNPVALWLYGVIRSHSSIIPRPLLYYHRMSGSGSSPPDFTRQVKRALGLLAEKHVIHSAELRQGKLFIQRERPTTERKLPTEDTEWHVLAGRKESAR